MMVSTYRTGYRTGIGIIKIETYRIEQGWEEVCRDGNHYGRRNTSFQEWGYEIGHRRASYKYRYSSLALCGCEL